MDRYNKIHERVGIVREKINSNKRSNEIVGASSQDKSLELKLGPPGENKPLHYTQSHNNRNITAFGAKREFFNTEEKTQDRNWLIDNQQYQSGLEKKPCLTPANSHANLGLDPNTSKKRTDVRPVIGWPPVRSSRKNLLSSNISNKLETEPSKNMGKEGGKPEVPEDSLFVKIKMDGVPKEGGKPEVPEDSLFVKIKMDGVPIGRKVDLKSYTNYDNLSSAVDQLFRGLLAAQGEISDSAEKTKMITGLLDGSGDYTLVYEDSEGDRMLVGDVPWHMFISSAKRLRVLKDF